MHGNRIILISIFYVSVNAMPQGDEKQMTLRPGRYVPELYGAHLGKYIPDDKGKYFHIHRPYDGGYGDRGERYIHKVEKASDGYHYDYNGLGPKDHLRFMIDFNFNGDGWQIIQFQWLRDDDSNNNFEYVKEYQLWDDSSAKQQQQDTEQSQSKSPEGNSENYNTNSEDNTKIDQGEDVHIEGEYNDKVGYNYSVSKDTQNPDTKNLKKAIKEVLSYIESNVFPTL